MSNNLRHLVAAVTAERALTFPSAAVGRIWHRYLLPAKQSLASPFGVRLSGVELKVNFGSPSHRRFGDILIDRGFKLPAHQAIRFLVSDQGWDSIPEKSNENPLMILVDISDSTADWSSLAGAPEQPLLIVNEENLTTCLADVALDLSLANSHFYSQIISHWADANGGIGQFFKAKAKFALEAKEGTEHPVPYVPLSWIAREGGIFGSVAHQSKFVECWDNFLLALDADAPIKRAATCEAICRYPNFGGQLSPELVNRAVGSLAKGSHVLFVERRSTKMRDSPSYRNEVHAVFSSINVRGGGGKPFGFFEGSSLPKPAQRLVEKGAAYALRIFAGEN